MDERWNLLGPCDVGRVVDEVDHEAVGGRRAPKAAMDRLDGEEAEAERASLP